jgi:hypothetical protein
MVLSIYELDEALDELIGEPIWITMAGDRIPISKLKNDHLANIIRYLRKQY